MTGQERKDYQRQWARDNRERLNTYHREWRIRNPDKVKAARIGQREWRKKNAEKVKLYHRTWLLQANYGLAPGDYDRLLVKQNGKCAICGISLDGNRREASIDHDHISGRIRGILCERCNFWLLPAIENDRHLLNRALEYLDEQDQGTTSDQNNSEK